MSTPVLPRSAPPPGDARATGAVRTPVAYPDSDGEPMADNTEQFEFIQMVQGNLNGLLPDFVAGDHLWYPVEGRPDIRVAPDVYVALGRPKGARGSYRQWVEAGVPLTVVFEWWSPSNYFPKQVEKLRFYDRYGVQEFYTWDQARNALGVFIRTGDTLEPVDTSEGFTSPLLGIRFEVKADTLHIFRPDGQPFRSFIELLTEHDTASRRATEAETKLGEAETKLGEAEKKADEAADRAERLAARLRALGIDPNAD